MIKLIINADDFGDSKLFNKAILELLEKNYIKSTTVMVNRLTKEQDNQLQKLIELAKTKYISIGLHLEFDVTQPLTPQIKKQYESLTSILGFAPSHLDFHIPRGSAVEKERARIFEEAGRFARQYNLPVRNKGFTSGTKQTTREAFICSRLKIEEIEDFLKDLKDGESCELITHPGYYDPNSKSRLNKEREDDYNNIIKLQDFLKEHENIKNISYWEL